MNDYLLADKAIYNQVIEDIYAGDGTAIHPKLFDAYAENLRKAVSGVFRGVEYGDPHYDTAKQLEANVSRFAAYKAYNATQQLRRKLTNDDGAPLTREEYRRQAQGVVNAFNRYQAVEHNTSVSRARTAKQWIDYTGDELQRELFPNMRWLPSRSSEKRPEHVRFYGHVWAKDSPHWSVHQPGNLYGCKCDWEQTDDPADGEVPRGASAQKGLRGNPGQTGEVFSKDAAYFERVPEKRRNVVEKSYGSLERSVVRESMKQFYGKTISKELLNGEIAKVEFSGRSARHVSNDLIGDPLYSIKNAIVDDLDRYLKDAELVGYMDNTKRDKKPDVERYYYFRFRFPGGSEGYIHVEQDRWKKQTVYAVTTTLRPEVTRIK